MITKPYSQDTWRRLRLTKINSQIESFAFVIAPIVANDGVKRWNGTLMRVDQITGHIIPQSGCGTFVENSKSKVRRKLKKKARALIAQAAHEHYLQEGAVTEYAVMGNRDVRVGLRSMR